MLTPRHTGDRSRRPMLLALVFGVVLVVVSVTASALVALTSAHLSRESLAAIVNRDAALARYVITDLLDSADLASADVRGLKSGGGDSRAMLEV